jgi:hypothetical protein
MKLHEAAVTFKLLAVPLPLSFSTPGLSALISANSPNDTSVPLIPITLLTRLTTLCPSSFLQQQNISHPTVPDDTALALANPDLPA